MDGIVVIVALVNVNGASSARSWLSFFACCWFSFFVVADFHISHFSDNTNGSSFLVLA